MLGNCTEKKNLKMIVKVSLIKIPYWKAEVTVSEIKMRGRITYPLV